LDTAEVARKIPLIRAAASLPVGIGFGIRDGKAAREMSQLADAVVIGSRIVEEIEHSTAASLLDNVYTLVKSFRDAMDGKD
ncbi:MAG: tryptophan synthase subunit alpha, partial [Sulfuricella sp.]